MGQGMPPVDGLLPDSGGSGIPTVEVPRPAGGGALAAMALVPADYSDGILEVSGRRGSPEPREWVIIARQNQDLSTLRKFVVAGGQLVGNAISVDALQAVRGNDYLAAGSLQIDSDAAFRIATAEAAKSGKAVATADYSLSVRGKGTAPVWSLLLYDAAGHRVGRIEIQATDGSVVSGV